MGLGYDVSEDKRDFQREGISGEVQRHSQEVLSYPCLMLVKTEGTAFQKYKLEALQMLFKSSKQMDLSEDNTAVNTTIAIYIDVDGKKMRLGAISPTQVKAFLRLFQNNKVVGMYDANKKLEGDMLYVLST